MNYPSIRIEGSILSPDLLDRLEEAPGQRPVDFGFDTSSKVKDEIARAWADAQDYWRIFQRKLETLKADAPATTETRNNWIVPLLGLLGYQVEYQARGTEVSGKNYPISHRATNRGQTAIHVIGAREPAGLDRKPEKSALRMSAHAMLQEYLNLTDQLYGLVTNGRVVRLLRDSSRLVKLTYLEFDLDRIFVDGLFADFAVLFRLLHASRLPQTVEASSSCWLERYHLDTLAQGSRIREGLRVSVTEALEILGTGFVTHPDNTALREQVSSGQLRPDIYFNHLLRLVYRLLFLMVIEERGLVFPKGVPSRNVNLYFQHYSVQRLRRMAVTRGLRVERFSDAWLALLSTFQLFEHPAKADQLGMSALGGQLFNPDSLGPLNSCRLSNAALFSALDRLCYFNHLQSGQPTSVNFGALATEEFGSVYESLLELHPVIEVAPTPRFGFRQAAGNERKTSGSYYTPVSLVDCLLDTALDPVLNDRIRNYSKLGFKSAEEAVLALKICDPACGSGHFLIAAAQRIARRLATLRAGNEEPGPELLRHSLREVIGQCIHGVDINPMSVELCKVGLWLEAVEPGKSLNFLDHHIKCGNSLLGATPEAIKDGIPDKAYEPITGDTREAAAWMKRLNRDARAGQTSFDFSQTQAWERLGNLPATIAQLETLDDETPEALVAKEKLYREIVEGSGYENARLLHDTWCAAFVWPKQSTDYGTELTTEHLRKIERNPHSVPPGLKAKIRDLARQYRFFHWHLEFPTVFGSESNGGFDVILGNPPWERVKLQEREWFASSRPDIADAQTAAIRSRLINELATSDPELYATFLNALRKADGESAFARNSGAFPLGAVGDTNTYPLFIELGMRLIETNGRLGFIVKTGILADYSLKDFFSHLVQTGRFVAAYDFSNRNLIFPAVVANERFTLLTLGGAGANTNVIKMSILNEDVSDLSNVEKVWELSPEDIALINPNTQTCPLFQTARDTIVVSQIYRRLPILLNENKTNGNLWSVNYLGMFHMTNDSGLFRDQETLETTSANPSSPYWDVDGTFYSALLEGKLYDLFDHRHGTFAGIPRKSRFGVKAEPNHPSREQLLDPYFQCLPRYWVPASEVQTRYSKRIGFVPSGVLTFRDVCRTHTDLRTVRACICPPWGAGNKAPLLVFPSTKPEEHARRSLLLCGNLSAFVLDYVARQKFSGGSLNKFILIQFPIVPPTAYEQACRWSASDNTLQHWLFPRLLELSYTAWDLESFVRDCHYNGPPFRWNEERRFLLRCELDAAYFHLYGIAEDDVDYIMETFRILKNKDIQKYGDYRSKLIILHCYDAMQKAISSGEPYLSMVDPPPAHPSMAQSPRELSAAL